MVLAFDLSARLGLCPGRDAERVRAQLGTVGCPAAASRATTGAYFAASRLIGHMGRDKKAEGGKLGFVLARGIGKAFLAARSTHLGRGRDGIADGSGMERNSIRTGRRCLIILLLLLLSAFFSAAETALTAVSRPRMHTLENRATGRPWLTACWTARSR